MAGIFVRLLSPNLESRLEAEPSQTSLRTIISVWYSGSVRSLQAVGLNINLCCCFLLCWLGDG